MKEKKKDTKAIVFVGREGERVSHHLWLSWRYFDSLQKTLNISAGKQNKKNGKPLCFFHQKSQILSSDGEIMYRN